jgi:hypothetical protein
MYASQTSTKPSVVWQGSTKDGYTLGLTRSALTQIGSKLKQTGLEHLVRRLRSNNQGSLESAVLGAIAQVVSNATRSRSGQNTQVFTAVGKTRKYQIATQPIGHQQSAILVVRSLPLEFKNELEGEFEYEYESELWNESEAMVGGGRRGSQQAGPSRPTAGRRGSQQAGPSTVEIIEKTGTTIAGDRILETPNTREGSGIYITQKHVYKTMGISTEYEKAVDKLNPYIKARKNKVPVPHTQLFKIRRPGRNDFVYVLRLSKIPNKDFFQMSKPGGASKLNDAIKQAPPLVLKNIIGILERAERIGIKDPQGFIHLNRNPPLTFIDLHLENRRNEAFQQQLGTAKKRLKELGLSSRSRR